MSDHSTLDGLGLSDELDMVWTRTHEAIVRVGYDFAFPPGAVVRTLGEGISSKVFYAKDLHDETPVAIKVFKDNDQNNVDMFENERKTLRRPGFPQRFCPGIIKACHESDAQPFMIMQYVSGLPINAYCNKRITGQEKKIETLETLFRGLQEVHEVNTTHRDISPANIRVDDQGNVRLLDFGIAGEIVKSEVKTIGPGHNAYSPGEVKKGKRAGAKDDIFNAGLVAVEVLTGKHPPWNETDSGDAPHLARCRRALWDAGCDRRLTRIVLRSLQTSERRYSKPALMADALFDYRVRRPQRIRTFWIAMALMFVVMCLGILGWWRHDQLQQDFAFRDYAELKQQTEDLPYVEHEAVAGRLEQAEQLRQQWKEQFDAGQREEAMATLKREMTFLQEAIDISRGLGRCLPRLEALGIPLNETPWIDQSPVIAKRRTELAQQYQDVTTMLNEGRIDDAWQAIDALQVTLAQLIRDNTEAGTAAGARSQYNNLAGSVSERLQADEEFAALSKLADLAERAWTTGDWKQTNMLFGQAMQSLNEWLEANETPQERIARTKANEERIAALETEQDRLRGEIDRITTQRDQHERRATELDKRIADITVERVDAMDELKTTRESLSQETAKRSAAEKLAQERVDLLTQLNTEKAGLEQRNQQLQKKSADLDQVERELAQAKERAKLLAEQLAAAQEETKRWKERAESTSQPATSTAVSPKWQATVCTNSIGMKLRLIPAGSFRMGGVQPARALVKNLDPDDFKLIQDEHPQHTVRVSHPFYLGVHEVTVGQFRQFVNATGYQTEAEKDSMGAIASSTGSEWELEADRNWKNAGFPQTDQHPVVCVSDNDVTEFLKWLSGNEGVRYDLPTEAQWEYACRAGTTTRFPYGDDVEQLAVYANVADGTAKEELGWTGTIQAKDGYVYTAPVGVFAPNAWGLHDMIGNAWEWTKDWYGEDYYAKSPSVDPTGPETGESRVFRGGGWSSHGEICRPAIRYRSTPEWRSLHALGFRVAHGLSSEWASGYTVR